MGKRIIKKDSVTNEQKLSDLLTCTDVVGECMFWNRSVNSDGYAAMAGNVKVHRLVYELATSEDIDGLVIRHKCDNPLCINPNHLISGSNAENMKDRDERGRTFKIITADVVRKVKAMLGLGMFDQYQIADVCGISCKRVSDIKCGRYNDDGKLTRYLK